MIRHPAFVLLAALAAAATLPPPPKTRTDNVVDTLHGVKIPDPYRWLEDQNSPETRAWIDAQNRYARPLLDAIPGRQAIAARLAALMKVDVMGMPRVRAGRYFFARRRADQDLFVTYVRKGLKGRDEVLIDPHPLSPDHSVSASLSGVSQDGTLAAIGVRQGGADEVAIKFLDVDTRKELPDQLPKARYFGISILPEKSGFYYSRHDKEGSRIYFHAFGQAPGTDREIFGKGYGPDKAISASLSEDGRYLQIEVEYGSAADRTEIHVQDLASHGPLMPIVNDIPARFFGEIGGDRMFLNTNWKAPKGRVLAVDLKHPARDQWREIIPEGQATIEGTTLAGHRVCVNFLENVASKLSIFEADGRHTRDIAFPSPGSVSGLQGRWDSDEAFFAFSSFHIPQTVYRYDMAKDQREVWSRPNVPVASDRFEVQQVWYRSKDGTKVPMFLMYAKGVKPDGSHPVYLTGYGGFTISLTPNFSALAVLWAERGGVYAVPNLRGGGEFGEDWHKAGMLGNKQHVFDDFIAAAEYLIEKGYTKASRLAIEGVSNGGLLVGAALTQRPDLFQAVVCGYPLLDMLRYQKFLVARFWVPEYGSSDDPAQFRWLRAYSPYQNVKRGTKYPAVLFVTGDSDTRVDPLHARKMAALLQASTGSDRPVLLLYDTKSGHSGGRPLGKQIEERTDELSFLLWQLGVAK